MASRQLDPEVLVRLARDKFIHLLECSHRDKALIIQSDLIKPLDRILGAKVLRQHGVAKIFRFEEFAPTVLDDSLLHVFLIRPSVRYTRRIAAMFSGRLPTSKAPPTVAAAKCQIVYAPRKLAVCDLVLERYAAFGLVATDELNWSFLPVDDGVLGLQLGDQYFASSFVDGTNLWFQTVAQALWQFQSLFGPFPGHMYCFGKSATVVANLTEDLMDQLGVSRQSTPCCGQVILLDRDVDPVAVLLSGLTYEALLDDHFGLQSAYLDVPKKVCCKAVPEGRVLLTASDAVYAATRDQHFTRVFTVLKQRTEALQLEFDKRHQLDVDQLKAFVKHSLRDLRQQQQSLALHIGLSELIVAEKSGQDFERVLDMEHAILCKLDYGRSVQFIQEYMAQRLPVETAFSLLCLLCIMNNGLPDRDYVTLRREFLQAYGHDYLTAFVTMSRCGLFFSRDGAVSSVGGILSAAVKRHTVPNVSQSIRDKFSLLPMAKVNLKEPHCPSYVFNGAYIPLACQLVVQMLNNAMPAEQSLRTVSNYFHLKEMNQPLALDTAGKAWRRTFVLVFLGGVTRAEIAGLRLIEKLKDCDIHILATNIISRRSLLNTMMTSAG